MQGRRWLLNFAAGARGVLRGRDTPQAGHPSAITRGGHLFRLRDAIDQFYADKNKYPASLEELVTEKYIRVVPPDPYTGSAETWQTIMSEPDPLNPTAQPGVYDVKSGSEGTALDGTKYADWE
jgi:hypothetical protein